MDLRQYLIDEFVEDYQKGEIPRRQAFRLLAGITGAATATALLAACGTPAAAQTDAPLIPTAEGEAPTAEGEAPTATPVPAAPVAASNSVAATDPRVLGGSILFPGTETTMLGYMARPAAEGSFPLVLVCHENRGLTPHIQDVTRRLAVAGYVSLAVDLLSREGGTAAVVVPDDIPGLLSSAPPERHVQDFQDGLTFVKSQPFARADSVGMVGFCFGGGITWRVAAALPELRAAVPFYGPPVAAEQVPNISAPVLAIYAGKDERINNSIPAIEEAMQANGKVFEKMIYADVDHAFNNDTGPRYSPDAALDAWNRTLEWFGRYLQA